jgi:hypothetical protein
MTRHLTRDLARSLLDQDWMGKAWCPKVAELPWTAEPDQVSFAAEVAMAAVCAACPVWTECAGYVADEQISSGFWAGAHRDPRRLPTRRSGIGPPSTGLGGVA